MQVASGTKENVASWAEFQVVIVDLCLRLFFPDWDPMGFITMKLTTNLGYAVLLVPFASNIRKSKLWVLEKKRE